MCRVEEWHELKLYASKTDASPDPIIPVLNDTGLVAMHGNKMLFRGMGRQGDPNSVTQMQEWSVQVTTEPRPGIAQQSLRPGVAT